MKKYINKVNIILVSLLFVFSILLVLNSLYDFQIPVQYSVNSGEKLIKTIKSNDVIETKIVSKLKKLESLKLEVKDIKGQLQRDNIFVSIYDNNDKLIYYSDLADVEFFGGTSFNFKFNTVNDSYNKEFKLIIKSKKIKNDYSFGIYGVDDGVKDTFPISQYGYSTSPFYTCLFTVILFIIFYILCRYNFKDNDLLKEKLLRKKIVFIIEFFASLIALLSAILAIFLGIKKFLA